MCDGAETTLGWGPEPVPDLLRFSHQAMATTFEILVCHPRSSYARQASLEAFRMLDRLEQQLSRFVAHSDVSAVNASRSNQSVLVGPETMECLQQARAAYDLTAGAFDVSVGAWMPAPEGGLGVTSPKAGMDLVRLDGDAMTVTRLDEAVQLDLARSARASPWTRSANFWPSGGSRLPWCTEGPALPWPWSLRLAWRAGLSPSPVPSRPTGSLPRSRSVTPA